MLAWERLWNEGLRDTYRAMYRKAHEIAPTKPMGWHIWHTNSFAPFYRAEQDYADSWQYSDFLKVVMYHNCGGPRMATYIRNINATLFADLTPEQTTELTYRIQQYGAEAPLDKLATAGAVGRLRACGRPASRVAGAGGTDQDLAGHRDRHPDRREREEDDAGGCLLRRSRAAFEGGADGILLSRKYSEMRLDNLRAAGRAAREAARA